MQILRTIQCLERNTLRRVGERIPNQEKVNAWELKMEKVNQSSALLNQESSLGSLLARATLVNGLGEIVRIMHRFRSVVTEKLKQHMDLFGNLKNKKNMAKRT